MNTPMIDIEALIRPNIRALKPYRSARQDYLTGVLLDANENAFGSAIAFDGLELNRYPDPFQTALRSRLAQLHGITREQLFVGVGSDEVIDLLLRIFCEPQKDSILILEPTYGMYRVAADVNNVTVDSCLLTDDFQLDVTAAKQCMTEKTKVIFCCSPNNPTGNLLNRSGILSLCAQTSALVVVDEAYADFAETESLTTAIERFPNLVVLRTLSKAWGLAAIRLGYAVAHPLIVSYLLKVKSPYNINILTSTEALKALASTEHVRRSVTLVTQERQRLVKELASFRFVRYVYPSDANFLLVRCVDARSLYQQLAQRGIIVRDRSAEPKLENCLRISVGTPEQNDLLLNALKELDV
jgi:histidinol-phosphate aminotransferase